MSGGHWGYLTLRFEEASTFAKGSLDLLKAIEHELDRGICGDDCYNCAKNRTIAGLERFFDESSGFNDVPDGRTAIEIVHDVDDPKLTCERCLYAKEKRSSRRNAATQS